MYGFICGFSYFCTFDLIAETVCSHFKGLSIASFDCRFYQFGVNNVKHFVCSSLFGNGLHHCNLSDREDVLIN